MSGELKPIQSSQSTSSALTIPDTCNFLALPREVIMLAILQRICKPEDVANLNLVSKFIKELNQDLNIADSRVKALFDKFFPHRALEICDSSKCTYRNYTGLYSFFQLYSDILSNCPANRRGWGVRPDPKLTIECYNALPVDMQTNLRWHIWDANYRNNEGHGIFYGEHVINTKIDSPLVLKAVLKYLCKPDLYGKLSKHKSEAKKLTNS